MSETIRTDVHFNSPFIQSKEVPRPLPEINDVPIEFELSELPTNAKRGVGLSGGVDSLVATHKAMSEGKADFVVHIDTGTNLTETVSWVREVCEIYGWPLLIASTTENPERYFCRYGAPDTDGHTSAFHTLKGRALRTIANHLDEFTLITGVYKRESTKRLENVSGEKSNPDYCAWKYWNLVWNWVDSDFQEYMAEHNLPQSPTKQTIHRSGDCQCIAFGHRDEIFVDIASEYPEDFAFLQNIELRMQEYRGRLLRVEDEYPTIYQQARDEWRVEGGTPYKTLDICLKENAPDVFNWAVDIDQKDAIRRGQQIASNYLGHGALTDAEQHGLVTQAEVEAGKQADLCAYGCGIESESKPRSVERAIQDARK